MFKSIKENILQLLTQEKLKNKGIVHLMHKLRKVNAFTFLVFVNISQF